MIIVQTPLRVSFLGGGTDYPEYFEKHGGAVLGTAINKSAFLSVSKFYSKLFDYSIRISYRDVECVKCLDEIRHRPFRECLRFCGIESDVEIDYSAELPAFTGLGSSSTFVVGLIKALYAYKGRHVEPIDLAYQAIDIERRVLGEAVGCQDQTFAAFGGFNLIEFKAVNDIRVRPLQLSEERIKEIQSHMMLFFTGVKRSAREHAARQLERVGANLMHLKMMRELVDDGAEILESGGDVLDFGRLLAESWQMKKSLDSSMSNEVVDKIYAYGVEAGAVGGKLLGAGGGGFVLLFVPPDRQEAVRGKLAGFTEIPVEINAPGSRVIYGDDGV